jgi:hypothetical protein
MYSDSVLLWASFLLLRHLCIDTPNLNAQQVLCRLLLVLFQATLNLVPHHAEYCLHAQPIHPSDDEYSHFIVRIVLFLNLLLPSILKRSIQPCDNYSQLVGIKSANGCNSDLVVLLSVLVLFLLHPLASVFLLLVVVIAGGLLGNAHL